MDEELRLATAPRWRGTPGRTEVWYATLSDPVSKAGLWVHHETVAPTASARREPHGHGWVTWFPPEGPPRTERFGPAPVAPAPAEGPWFAVPGVHAELEHWNGTAGSLAWDLTWKDPNPPLWTFPRVAWARELLPGAQLVLAPSATFAGTVTVDGAEHALDGWQGGVAHIYGHGNAKRWAWLHADLGGGDVLEVVTAVSHKPGLRALPPLAFLRFRIAGEDWPASPLPALRMRTTLGLRHWQLEGRIGDRHVLVRVDQPEDRCVSLRYTDPDGATAVCTNTEQADIHVEVRHRERGAWVIDRTWSVLGTGHAEVGLRGDDAPATNERTPS